MKSLLKLMKGAGWLNILGMSAAFAAIYIILVQVNYDLNFNRSIKDSERIYVVAHPSWVTDDHYMLTSNRPNTEFTLSQSTKVESFGFAGPTSQEQSISLISGDRGDKTEVKFKTKFFRISEGAINLLDFKLVSGDFQTMKVEGNIAISERLANNMNAKIGDAIHVTDNDKVCTIVAIYKNMPVNSEFGEIDLFSSNGLDIENIDKANNWSYRYYVKLYSSKDREIFEDEANEKIKTRLGKSTSSKTSGKDSVGHLSDIDSHSLLTLLPINGLHFNQRVDFYSFTADKTATMVLIGISILILLITLINYVNFFLAQVPLRLRSVNTKKILGSSRLSLVMHFLAESGCFVVIALLIAAMVVVLIKDSSYMHLLSCSLDMLDNLTVVCITTFIALLMTIISSIYPALYITSFPAAMAIKGAMGSSKGKTSFQYTLLGFQFVVTLVFVICASMLKMEYNYLMDYDMGFNKTSLYSLDLYDTEISPHLLSEELKKSPAISDVTLCDASLVSEDVNIVQQDENEYIFFQVAPNFLKFMGIDVIEGRDFSDTDKNSESSVMIFNDISRQKMDLKLGEDGIIGFCNNFHFQPLMYDLSPYAFVLRNEYYSHKTQLTHVYFRTLPTVSYEEIRGIVSAAVAKFSDVDTIDNLSLQTFNDELAGQYEKQKNDMDMITLFSILAITISLMGIVGLLMFETTYRQKEIGIRRVHGAEISEILLMFNKRFAGLLFICFLISAPISYYVTDYYYSTFAYRASIPVWIFLVAFALVLVITVVVVTLSTYKTAAENPSESLKSE